MAGLFELAVGRLLRESLHPRAVAVREQSVDFHAPRDGDGARCASVGPDLMLVRGARPLALADAKYKDYRERRPDRDAPARQIGNDDLYQPFFYASQLQVAHGLAAPPPAIIVAPLPAGTSAQAGPWSSRGIVSFRSVLVRMASTASG